MASGDVVVIIEEIMPPATSGPGMNVRQGGSSPAERVTVWQFDGGSSDEVLDFKCRLQGYDGGGLTFSFTWSAATATTGDVRWGIAIRRVQDDAEDIDASHTYDYNEVTDTCASASGEISYPTITFTNGADMDSWADGEVAIVRIRREASDTTLDTMAGDAEIWDLVGKET